MRTTPRSKGPLDRIIQALDAGGLRPVIEQGFRYVSPENQSQADWKAEHFAVQFTLKGKATYRFGTRRLSCRAGELLLVAPGVVHDYRIDKGLSGYFLSFRLDGGAPPILSEPFWHVPQAWALLPTLKGIFRENRRPGPWRPSRMRALVSLLLSGILMEQSAAKRGKKGLSDGQCDTLDLFLLRNASRPVASSELAALLHLSRAHFNKLFRNTHGVSPRLFIMRERLRQASLILRQERVSVAEVAGRFGYASIPTFNRQYKKLFGEAPGKHRGG